MSATENTLREGHEMTDKYPEIYTAELFTNAHGSMRQAVWYLTDDLKEIAQDLNDCYDGWDYAIVVDTNDVNSWCVTRTIEGVTVDKIPF